MSSPQGQRSHCWGSTEGWCWEKPGELEQSLSQVSRAWHSSTWSNLQAPQKGGWKLLQHFSASALLWHSAGYAASCAGEPGPTSLRITPHLPFSTVASASCSPQHRTFTACNVSLLKCYLFSFYFSFPPYSEDSPGTIPVSAGAE